MRLSDALMLGSTLRSPGFGGELTEGGTCARGAAVEAVGKLVVKPAIGENLGIFWAEWPWTRTASEPCPVVDCRYNTVMIFMTLGRVSWLITHLNDQHQWTREKIASWIRQIEPQDVQESVVTKVDEVAVGVL